ncbi:hypothetical protein AB9K26_00215, partial [Psychroserpens sp. XS_ASV72]|uniref:hypothetical protein n=1 Tax=Psychroserpens sp. XS_ASV72 TaxID=3241293 RepID=UPI0035115905
LNFDYETNKILNITMFCLIGIAYLAFAWAFDNIKLKIVLTICGIYLIVMNFIPQFSWNSIIGIACILTPMIIGKVLSKKDELEESVTE